MTTFNDAEKTNCVSLADLREITAAFLDLLNPELWRDDAAFLKNIALKTQSLFPTGEASIFLVTGPADKKAVTFKASSSDLTNQRLAGFQLRWGEGAVGWVIKTGQAQLISDTKDSQNGSNRRKFNSAADERSDYSTRCLACAPLMVQQQAIGAIEIVDQVPRCFSANDLARLDAIANVVTIALQNIKYLQLTRRRSLLLTTNAKVMGEVVSGFSNFSQLLEKITDSIHLNFDFYYTGVYLINEPDEPTTLSLRAVSSKNTQLTRAVLAAGHQVEVGDGLLVGWAAAHGKPCIVLSENRPLFRARPSASTQFVISSENSKFIAANRFLPGTRSAMALPLVADRRVIGVILIQREDAVYFSEENFCEEDSQTLQDLANQLAFIIRNGHLYYQTRRERQDLEGIIKDIDRKIIGTTDQNLIENLRLVLLKGLALIGAESGQILFYDDQTKMLEEKVATTEISTNPFKSVEGVFDYVISPKKSAIIPDLEYWEPTANMKSRLVVPLIADDLVIGVFIAESALIAAFDQTHQAIIEMLAPQLALAIQNAHLFEQTSRRVTLLKATSEISSNAVAIRNFDDLLRITTETIVEKFGFYYAAIFLVDETKAWAVLRAGSGELGQTMLLNGYRVRIGSDAAVGQAAGPLRKARLTAYAAQESPFESPLLPDIRSEIALPLHVKIGKKFEVFGALSVHRTEKDNFSAEEIDMLQAVADQLAVAISNADLYRRTKAKEQLIEVLREIDRRIINLDESRAGILNFILAKSCELTGAEAGQIFLLDENVLKVVYATAREDLNDRVPILIGTVVGDAVFRGHLLISNLENLLAQAEETPADQAEKLDYSQAYKKTKHSRAATCLYEEDGNVIGVLSVEHSEPNKLTSEHIEILSALAGQAAITIKNHAMMAQAEIRNRHLEATAQVGADIIASLNLEELLKRTVELIFNKFNLDYAGIFLVEEADEKDHKPALARLQQAKGQDASRHLKEGRQFEVGSQTIIGLTTGWGKAQFAQVTLGGSSDLADVLTTSSKMSLPLRNRLGIIGALEVQSTKTIFTEDDAKILQTLADQLAIAIYNAKLYQRTEADKQQLAALRAIDQAIINTELDRDQTLKFILEQGLALINTQHGSISLLEEDQTRLKVVISSRKEQMGTILPVDKSILGLTIEKQQALRIADVSLEPRYQIDYSLREAKEVVSVLLVPLKENETMMGVFAAFNNQRQAFSAQQQETLERLAGQAAIAIKNASLFSQAERRAALLKAAAQVSRSVISIFDLAELLDQIVNTICDQFKEREFHYAAVFLVDETGKYARQQASAGESHHLIEPNLKYKIGLDDSIVSRAIQRGQGLIELVEHQSVQPVRFETESEMALPLKIGLKVIGTLTVHSRKRDAFTDEDLQTLQTMADQLAIAIDNVKKQEKLLEAETLKTIDEATSQSMHWVANKARPIKEYIERLEQKVGPLLSTATTDQEIKEDFFEAIEVIKQNSDLILNIKQDIMGTAREFELVKIKLAEIVKEATTHLNLSKQQIEQDITPGLSPVWVDRVAIREVFSNLFANALQAMKYSPAPKLRLEAKTVEAFVEVKVIDNGAGIPSHKLKDIWIPFYTTKADSGGTGVGLSYCLQAMHKMHGQIRVESEVGQGTTFTLKLPTFRKEQ